jgi:hypothetical protein
MRYTVAYQVGQYRGIHVVHAEDEETAIAKTRKWARALTAISLAYESFRITVRDPEN